MNAIAVEKVESAARLVLRLAFGLFLALGHGWTKVAAAYGFFCCGQEWRHAQLVQSLGLPLPAFLALCSALAEFAGGLLIAAGLFTRYAALAVLINMMVAVYRNYLSGGSQELATLFLALAFFFLASGAGRLSIDALGRRER